MLSELSLNFRFAHMLKSYTFNMAPVQRRSEKQLPLHQQPVNAAPPVTNNESLLCGKSGDMRVTSTFPVFLPEWMDQREIKIKKTQIPWTRLAYRSTSKSFWMNIT